MKRIISAVLLVLTLMAISGCKGNGDDGEINVLFIPKLTGNAFFEAAKDGAISYGERNGFNVIYMGSPVADSAEQIKIIDDAVKNGVDGKPIHAICVSSLDATALDEALKNAAKAGIVVTTWDSDVSGDARRLMVSQGTPKQLGEMLVDMAARSLSDRGMDPSNDAIKYVWHYSRASVADQNSWQVAGEEYIRNTYPNWENVNTDNYYSNQDDEKAVSVGEEILNTHTDIDLIICNDSTSLPGQAQAMKNLGLNADDVTVTGFSPPNGIKSFCSEGIITRWGLWDCKIQGALGCYLAYYLASGNDVKVGDVLEIPEIGTVEVMPNTVLDASSFTSQDSGVVLLPARTIFTADNMDDYDF